MGSEGGERGAGGGAGEGEDSPCAPDENESLQPEAVTSADAKAWNIEMPTVLFSVCRASCFFWEEVRSKVDPGLTAMRSPILTRVSRDFRLQAERRRMKLGFPAVSFVEKGNAEPYTVPKPLQLNS